MTTLAAALSNSATEMRVDAADADPAPYYQIDSEVVRLLANSTTIQDGFSPSRTLDMTLWQIERGDAATTPASHLSGATVSPLWPQVDSGGGAVAGTVVVTPPNEVDIGAALDASMTMSSFPPAAFNGFATLADVALGNVLIAGNDAGGLSIVSLADPTDAQDAATKAYADTAIGALTLAAVLAAGNDTGGVAIVHNPAVDVDADAAHAATATGSGNAFTRSLAVVEDGDAVAGPRAEATGTGETDACAYARSVDGSALADNDAVASGDGYADAGGYATSVDGGSFTGGMAITTGIGLADATDLATTTTGTAQAGSMAVRGAASAGMSAVVDGTSARMAFNGTTPIAIPVLPATGALTLQDFADVFVALGLATQTP